MGRFISQLNLQESLGGGEIYTRFVVKAFADLGWGTRLFVSPRARFWEALLPQGTQIVPLESLHQLGQALHPGTMLLTHSALDPATATRIAQQLPLVGILHMPLYERLPAGLAHYHRLLAVSRHVAQSARSRGLDQVSPIVLLGVADTHARGESTPLRRTSCYDWDRRKLRDRVLGWLEACWPGSYLPGTPYRRVADSLTIGIVSRLTPIKQFPLMFSHLAPIIARYPKLRIEIFGSGGYASVRDLRRALQPCGGQVRFWGHQSDVASIYPQMDYVLSGLPEKEALGLNLIEAQTCGTPVLAVASPPFTETVVDGESGFLFEDPRKDHGAGFAALLERLSEGASRPDPLRAVRHLEQFSQGAFRARLQSALQGL